MSWEGILLLPGMQPPYKPPVAVAPGVWMLPVPIPIPLRYVNCYLCAGRDGWTLVDTGFHDELAEDAWQRAFAELKIRPDQVEQILVTHYHPDHLGAAGWLQQLTGAPVYLHDREQKQLALFWGEGVEEQMRSLREFFLAEGMPRETAEAITRLHQRQRESISPLPAVTPLATGQRFRIGTYDCEVLWTPGHSDGLAVFWAEADGLLFADDMLLDKITPNVSLWPGGRPDPLQDFLASLERVAALPARLALPGHRTLITDVAGRARQIQQHHDHRLALMAAACQVPGGATAWEVCEQIFEPDRLTVHQVRFAMSETLAHLVHMERKGQLKKREGRFLP